MHTQTRFPTALLMSPGADVVKIMAMLERPSAAALAQYDRGEKYQRLMDHARRCRSTLIDWIDEQGLSAELVRIQAPTCFNVLFIEGTEKLAKALYRAPSVVYTARVGDL